MTTEQKYKRLKKRLGITDKDVAKMFGYASLPSFSNSSGRIKIVEGIVSLYEMIGDKLTDDFTLGE